MPHDYDLDQLQRKLGRLEAELTEARRQLDLLATAASAVPPSPATPVEPERLANVTALPAVPATLAEPPLLPPLLAPAVPPASAFTPVKPPPPAAPGGLRVWLEGFGLWPPSGDANIEARLGAWWATRLGALLAVIGVVFFGIYVSRNTPPVVKLAELVVVALAVFGAGLRLGRRWPRFGPVVAGAGLALFYFSAFAAYAVPAVRVIDDALTAAIAQLVVVGLVLGFAGWRRSETTAGMAVGLGFVTAFFSGYCGLEDFSLWSAVVLAAGSAGLRAMTGWRSPMLIALPLAYAVYVVQGFAVWVVMNPGPELSVIWVPLLVLLAVFLLPDALAAARGAELKHDDRVLQNLNTSAAIAAALLVAPRVLQVHELAVLWFWSGGVMLVLTVFWWLMKQAGSLVPVVACKAAGLIALGVITEYDGHLRWLALLVQAFVLLTAARVTAIRGLRTMMVVVWGISLLLVVRAIVTGEPLPAFGTMVYLGFSAVLLGYDERWLGAARGFSLLAGALLGIAAGYAGEGIALTGWAPATFMAMAGLLAVAGWVSGGWHGPAVAAGVLVAGAHLAMLAYARRLYPDWWLWANEGVLLAGVISLGAASHRFAAAADATNLWRTVRIIAACAAVVVLEAVFFKGLARGEALAASVGTAVLLLALSPWVRAWPFVFASTLGLVLGWLLHRPLRVRMDDPWLLVASTGAWALPVIWQLSSRRQELIAEPKNRRLLAVVLTVLATWISLLALRSNFTGPALFAAVAAEALAVFVLAWRLGVRPAFPAASVLLLGGAWWTASALVRPAGWLVQPDWPALTGVLALAAVALVLPVLGRHRAVTNSAVWRRYALWVHGAGALLLLFWFFAEQTGVLAPYATVLWGGVAIALFVAGLFARERVYRLVGLAGLALCVPRVFLVDLDSTLYRIVAFVVLGLVLLWVGFSYHRFRHLIAEPDEPAGHPPPN